MTTSFVGYVVEVQDVAPPDIPAWMLPVCVIGGFTFAWLHWSWRSGRPMTSERFRANRANAAFWAGGGYSFLPGAITCFAWGAGLAIFPRLADTRSGWLAYGLLLAAGIGAVAMAWGIKEQVSPTARRTPEWLRQWLDAERDLTDHVPPSP